jgi:hypothetical protein
MLRLLTRLFTRRRKARAIFSYWNGREAVWADPIVLQRDLDKHGGEHWTAHIDYLRLACRMEGKDLSTPLAAEQNKAAEEAIEALAVLVRKAFGVETIKDAGIRGLTDAECIDLLAEFMAWMRQAEEDARPFRNSPRPMEPSPAISTTE